jgi:hypothetical protein
MSHHLTQAKGNFAQVAHIVAFSEDGPRGRAGSRRRQINEVANLMLLCPDCHKLIDSSPEKYTVATLMEYKRRHEARIQHVTGLGPDLQTTVVQLKANIRGQTVAIPVAQVTEAVAPRYPTDAHGYVIDLTNIHGDDEAFIQTATHTIRREMERLYAPGMDIARTRHISLFALAPIPLLVFLGSQLSNKVPVDLYQRHRDAEDWVWKTDGNPIDYQFQRLRVGIDRSRVALLLSLSGKIHVEDLPTQIDESFTIYEITLRDKVPTPTFLRLGFGRK